MIYFVSYEIPEYLGLVPVKIGYTNDLSTLYARLRSVQTGAPWKLEPLALHEKGTRVAEKHLHKIFKKDRMKGEWFARSGELSALIEWLQEGGHKYVNEDRLIFYSSHLS